MKSTSFRKALVPGVAVLALALTACGAGNESDTSADQATNSGSETTGAATLAGDLAGGGASSQEKAQAAWTAGFQTANPDVNVTYDPVGSGTGRENFSSGAFAFAGTDSAMSDDEGELTKAQDQCASDVIQIPAYVSPIAVVFNLKGVDSLNLSAPVLAEIFSGKITKWNDPAITALNEGVDLPGTAITPVHRQDDSGTTDNFTQYLAAAAEGKWTFDPDGVWPNEIKGGEAAEGTSGVIGAVQAGDGMIGYADHSAAGELGVAKVQVGEEFNEPTAEGAAKVVAISPAAAGVGPTDMAVDLARDTTEAGAYPIVLVSYLLACSNYSDAKTADLVKGYLTYAVSSEGQDAAAQEAGSAPLDAGVADKAKGLIDAISAK